MRKLFLGLIVLAVTSTSAEAISRYNSTSMSCSKAKAIVRSQGAVIFRYPSRRNPSLTLYDRFVAHGGLCAFGETAAPKSVPTRSGNCRLIACLQRNDGRGGHRRRGGGNDGYQFYNRN
ncbi:MAG: hypothetical protein AB3N20_21250 [Rhizobiaceae bacterium]